MRPNYFKEKKYLIVLIFSLRLKTNLILSSFSCDETFSINVENAKDAEFAKIMLTINYLQRSACTNTVNLKYSYTSLPDPTPEAGLCPSLIPLGRRLWGGSGLDFLDQVVYSLYRPMKHCFNAKLISMLILTGH